MVRFHYRASQDRAKECRELPDACRVDTSQLAVYEEPLIAQAPRWSIPLASRQGCRYHFLVPQIRQGQWSRRCNYRRSESAMVQEHEDMHQSVAEKRRSRITA